MQTPMIAIALFLTAGLLLGRAFLFFPSTILVVVLTALIAAVIIMRARRIREKSPALVAACCLLGAGLYIHSANYFPPDHYRHMLPADGSRHAVVGRIVSPIDRDPGRTGFTLSLKELDGTAASGRIHVSIRNALTDVGYGDIIQISGRIYRPRGFRNPGGFDYPAYLAAQGVHATMPLREADPVAIMKRGQGIFRTVQDWRERIRGSFRASLTGDGSAIIQAMVLGEEGDLSAGLRDRFMAAGVTHIISISGSHLGMLALLCFGLFRGVMFLLPARIYHRLTLYADLRKIAVLLTIPVVLFYSALAGGQVATIRSLIMIIAALAALVSDRESSLLNALAIAAFGILILSPQALFDISFQLSFVSVLVIGFVVTLWSDLGIEAHSLLKKVSTSILVMAAISCSLAIATGPLVAFYFSQLSLVGVVSNMVVVPFAGIAVVPVAFFSGIASLVAGGLPLAGMNQAVADAFILVVSSFARIPYSEIHPPAPSLLFMVLYAVTLIAGAGLLRIRLLAAFKPLECSPRISRRRYAVIAAGGVLLVIAAVPCLLPRQNTRVHFIDVGQGDSALIELQSGENILIDGGGTPDNRFDIGRRVVGPYLWNRGIRQLDLVIASHPHPDHRNGLVYIVNKFHVSEAWMNSAGDAPGPRDPFVITAGDNGVKLRTRERDAAAVHIGEAMVRVLHPAARYAPRGRRGAGFENDRSLVVMIREGGAAFLFPGDIGADAEAALVRSGEPLQCSVLKVPHHGSKNSNTEMFVRAASPDIAVISVGRGNRYRQPAADVVDRYEKNGAGVFRTDRDGTVIVTQAKGTLSVTPWASLLIERVPFDLHNIWSAGERENWTRIWKRAMLN